MHSDEPSEKQIEIFKAMSPQRKLDITLNMYRMARELKTLRLRELHPDWSREKVEAAVREIFLNART
ncbi:MAG: hypothetical protein AMJ79_04055 [Phycisphaerae bacterium SM23_30]|nr:MAG: hypothetical protein AMJ79_04055 [Phycisphaerae bacterium SM23_30]